MTKKVRVRVKLDDGQILFVYNMTYSSLEFAWRNLQHLQQTRPEQTLNLSRTWNDPGSSQEYRIDCIDLSSKEDFLRLNAS